MKTIKNVGLKVLILFTMLCANYSYAWSTRDFGNDGPYPELLAQATCLYDANNYYQSGPYSNSHSYTGKMGGFAIWGTGSGGANTGLGIGGTGFYETGNTKYFVGRYAEYITIRKGGKELENVPYYKYQICYVNAVSFSYYGYENSTSSCPSTHPSGAIYIQKRYEVWTDGSVRSDTGWYETSRTCTAVYSYTEVQYQSLPCSAYGGIYTDGGNGIAQQRSRAIWTDGARDWSAWSTTSNTCYRTVSEKQAQKTYACSEGQIGKIIKEPRRTYIDYAADASKTQAEKNALKEKYATAWTEFTVSNTCTTVEVQPWSESGKRTVTCESVLGSGYTGTATQTGTYIYTYNSTTRQTTSTFSPTSTDTSTCSNTINDLSMETRTIACPSGQNGNIVEYRYAATNSNGTKTYPQGESYQTLSNNCYTNNVGEDNSSAFVDNSEASDLLSTTTLNANNEASVKIFRQYVESLNVANLKNENYKLNLVFEDMSKGSYNMNEIGNLIRQYKAKVAGHTDSAINLAFPKTLDKYIGHSDLNRKNIQSSYIDSVKINENMNLDVTYKVINTKTGKNESKTIYVPFLNGSGLVKSDFNSI